MPKVKSPKKIEFKDLAQMMANGFGDLENKMDKKFEQVDKKFGQVDKNFKQVDKNFKQVDKNFELIFDDLRLIKDDLHDIKGQKLNLRLTLLEDYVGIK